MTEVIPDTGFAALYTFIIFPSQQQNICIDNN